MRYVYAMHAEHFQSTLEDNSVKLLLIDPPFFEITKEKWDNQWKDEKEFVNWLTDIVEQFYTALTLDGSILMFGGMGRHGCHPLFEVVKRLEKTYFFRNWITWKKRRAYGKSHDYLYCREEIIWLSRSDERTSITFNIPLLDEKRGYAGYNSKYPAKSEFKRVSNVWNDIDPSELDLIVEDCPELMRPERAAQKPQKLLTRLIETHSDPGDLVVDCFSGYGSTGIAALAIGRRFQGCEALTEDANSANDRCVGMAKASAGEIYNKPQTKKQAQKSSMVEVLDDE